MFNSDETCLSHWGSWGKPSRTFISKVDVSGFKACTRQSYIALL